jgi:predicted transcriptional regulator
VLKLEHRRSEIEIIAAILRQGEGSKTEIMYDVGLSYYQLKRYIRRLLELRLIDKETFGKHLNYRVTRKGQHLLEEIDVLLTMLKIKETV